jgi:hypothetical protein
VADARRRIDSLRTQLDQSRAECALLRSVVGWIDPEYSAALVALAELALLDLRRPEDLGGPVNTGTPGSRPPAYNHAAYSALKHDRFLQRKRATELRAKLRFIVDQDTDPEDGHLHPLQVTLPNVPQTG